MTTADNIRELMQTVPFEPFRIVMCSGKAYDIQRKNGLMVTRHTLYLGVYRDPTDDIPEKGDLVPIEAIARLLTPIPITY
jgi:hypothetical protein